MSAVIDFPTRTEGQVEPTVTGFEDLPPVMSTETLAQILEVSKKTLERMRDKNEGPRARQPKGMSHYRYYRTDVIAWLLSGSNEEGTRA